MSEDPYWQRAEFLIVRGYVPQGTDVSKLAEKLRQKDEKKLNQDSVNSRETVYQDLVPVIDKMMEDKAPVEKRLLRPYESAANKKDLDSL